MSRKVPGELISQPKKSSQGYIGDLSKKEKFELDDLLTKQDKLLANKSLISKLPDKGAKIIEFREKILKELKQKNTVENAAKLFSELNISTNGKAAMSELEWTGKYTEKPKEINKKIVELDSDDEIDPLKILAQPTGSGTHKKKIIKLAPEQTLIKPEDLKEIESFQSLNYVESPHMRYILDKVENNESNNKREPFKPFKTTKSNVHDVEKEKLRDKSKVNKFWEVTAATPPTVVHGAAKKIDIKESIKLQKEHEIRLKDLQIKNAAERLARQLGTLEMENLPVDKESYRTHPDDSHSSESEMEENHQEVYDEEDNDKAGTVVFNVDSMES